MSNILVDIDGVLANFVHGVCNMVNDKYGEGTIDEKSINKSSPAQWQLPTPDKDTLLNDIDDWITDGGLATLEPFNEGLDLLSKLKNYNIYIVTARSTGKYYSEESKKQAILDTKKWLSKFGIPIDNLYFTKNKVDFCKHNDIKILIEDTFDTAFKAAKENILSFLINRSYNQNRDILDNLHRINDYNDIITIINKQNETQRF